MKNTNKAMTLTTTKVATGTVLTAMDTRNFASTRLVNGRNYEVLDTRIMDSGLVEVLIGYAINKKAWFETSRFEKFVSPIFNVGQEVILLSDSGIEDKATQYATYEVLDTRNNEIKILNDNDKKHWLRVERFEAVIMEDTTDLPVATTTTTNALICVNNDGVESKVTLGHLYEITNTRQEGEHVEVRILADNGKYNWLLSHRFNTEDGLLTTIVNNMDETAVGLIQENAEPVFEAKVNMVVNAMYPLADKLTENKLYTVTDVRMENGQEEVRILADNGKYNWLILARFDIVEVRGINPVLIMKVADVFGNKVAIETEYVLAGMTEKMYSDLYTVVMDGAILSKDAAERLLADVAEFNNEHGIKLN